LRVEIATLAKNASVDRGGKVNLRGAGAAVVMTSDFPIPIELDLVLRIVPSLPEAVSTTQGEVYLVSSDGERISTKCFELASISDSEVEEVAGIAHSIAHLAKSSIVSLRDFEIPQDGDYHIEVLLNGVTIIQLPLCAIDERETGGSSIPGTKWM